MSDLMSEGKQRVHPMVKKKRKHRLVNVRDKIRKAERDYFDHRGRQSNSFLQEL